MTALQPETIEALARMDALERVAAAGSLIEEHRQAMAVLAQVRSQAVAELRAEGRSLAEIARHLNVTRQQVHRLQNASLTPEGL